MRNKKNTPLRSEERWYGHEESTKIIEVKGGTGRRGGGQNLERPNVERPIFRKFKIVNIKNN